MSTIRYWLNVDKVTKVCTVHTIDCFYKPRKSKFKNIRSMGRDGGWMPFSVYSSLFKYKRTRFNLYKLNFCSFCNTHAQMRESS